MNGGVVMIELSELIGQAESEGITLTKRQLWHWTNAGLISPPVVSYGGARGARSEYADDTLDRIRLILESLAERRNVDFARLALWRAGYDVDLRPLTERGLEAMRAIRERVRQDREAVQSDNDAHRTLDEEPLDARSMPLVRKVHKRLARRAVADENIYGAIVFEIAQVYAPDRDEYARDYFAERAYLPDDHYAMDSAFFRALMRLVQLRLGDGPRDIFAGLRPHFDPDNLEEVLADISSDRLRALDRDLREMLLIVNSLLAIPAMLRGREVKPVIVLDAQPPEFQVLTLLVWASFMMSPSLRSQFERVVSTHRKTVEKYS